ncbi:DUF3667 domain-containing protein [Tenacibaculum sp. Mcav3-52]|uniref:DUF3667 domain-containing protein n=1 Tax=Tenacibaculum TaxID=104267 RepID=UPI00064A8F8A|nr:MULTISPECIES: DUF3667 domain-containing protein [Tenacibaculum]MCG7501016.1 DUF3667 domain-containing protein [Tenacibaculum sp. Mcav3-52]
MIKKNKVPVIKDANCLNCGCPFTNNEKFCPECGQKNRGKKITLSVFLRELFAGFFSLDTKFWRTLIPLLISPGKVSKDYIEGKRIKYTNPFRFYLATSIIFFLIISLTDSYKKFEELRIGRSSNIKINNDDSEDIQVDLDSIQSIVFKQLEEQDSINTKQTETDSTKVSYNIKPKTVKSNLSNSFDIIEFMKFQKTHPKTSIDAALDSLQVTKNFSNRFWYSRAKVFNSIFLDRDEAKKFFRQVLSYASIALFVLLPLFTLFLKLIYIRKKYTYVEHLVFVFHVQTVLFLLFSIFYIIDFFKHSNNFLSIFLLLFMVYLYIAMKRFYNQGYFKTFTKYMLANTMFFILAMLGSAAISFAAFALY